MTFGSLGKFFVLAACIAIGVFQYSRYQEELWFDNQASTLAALIDPSLRSASTPKSVFDRSVFETIAFLYSTPGLVENAGSTTTLEFDRLIGRACEFNGCNSRLTSAYIRTLNQIFDSCSSLEIFDPLDSNLIRMEAGIAPRVNSGIYEGDKLAVSYLVPPLAAPNSKNQIPNVTVVPTTAHTLRGETVDTQAYRAAMTLRSVEIIPEDQYATIEKIFKASSRLPN